jgi:diguanylate cyclase (GGDEF)-like protein/PAS domain S-box-containing protein
VLSGLVDGKRREAVLAAAVLFAAIFVLRFAVDASGDAITFLYVIPVVLAAIALGVRAGLLAAAIAFALSTFWALVDDAPITALGYANRAIVFLFVGGLAGDFATRLRRLEAESARHFNLSRDMICIAGFDGYFKRVNPAFEEILGYSERELLGRPFIEFVHPEDHARTVEEAVAIGEGRSTVQFRNRYLDKRGEVRWIEWTSVGILEEDLIYAVARDVTDRKALEEELERLSRHDSLTGLLNRRSFDEALEGQLAYSRRYGRAGALLILDLDRFKQINDRFGHAVGDEAICTAARILGGNLRRTDTVVRGPSGSIVARLGGDEFAVLLPEVDAAGAEAVAERLVAALAASSLEVEGDRIHLAVSAGIALFGDGVCPPARDLLAEADRAMYVAKAAGGGGAVLAGVSA